jgi:hypothetical protein
MDEAESRIILLMGQIARRAGDQVVGHHDGVAAGQKVIAKVGTDETGAARKHYTKFS